ncbi:unnamed protein product [Parajaminaea phylloscopi]
MSFFRSLRSKSHKDDTPGELGTKPAGSANSTNGAHSATLPASTSSRPDRPGSLKASKSRLFGSTGSQIRRKNSSSEGAAPRPINARSASSVANYSSALPRVADEDRPAPAPQSPPASSPPAALTNADLSPPPGARPSDLFAGKGLEWGKLDLSGGGPASQTTAKSDDLQNFLKARRQWVPTFVTEPKDESDVRSVTNADDIAFSDVPQTGSLLSIKDLDESHQRKQKLLSGFEASDWTKAAHASTSAVGGVASSSRTQAKPKSPSSPPRIHTTAKPPPSTTAPGVAANARTTKSGSSGQPLTQGNVVASDLNTPQNGQVPDTVATNGSSAPAAATPTVPEPGAPTPAVLPQQVSNPTPALAEPPTATKIDESSRDTAVPVSAAPSEDVEIISSAKAPATTVAPASVAESQRPGTSGVRASTDTAGAFVTPSDSANPSEAGHSPAIHEASTAAQGTQNGLASTPAAVKEEQIPVAAPPLTAAIAGGAGSATLS